MSLISIKEAVLHAKESLNELYQDDPPKAMALEEIELIKTDGRHLWSVTLGFYRPKSVTAVGDALLNLANMASQTYQVENRVYKTVFIDASTGEFVKMDMRQVQ